ncbi:MAG: hybrid sensor histidine kinase/response regulator [Granulosicoccus sp.]|nr:hybrid sensor histidine kinase/response regulator [Granulosicoccus sp.]
MSQEQVKSLLPQTQDTENGRLLLIDDDPSFVHLCKRYLKSDEQFNLTVVSAASCGEALAFCNVDCFDCIVVDYHLPDGLGTDLLANLCRLLADRMPPAVVLTSAVDRDAPVKAMRNGACDFIYKSEFNRSSFRRTVKNAVRIGQLQRDNRNRLTELEAANDQLRSRSEEIQRFYQTVSHEVKTPLTAIREFVSIVHDGLAGEVLDEQKRLLRYALQGCDQIKNHFNDLLELSRFETGKINLHLAPDNIYEVFDHCLASASPLAIAKGIQLEIVDQPDLPLIMMQRDRVVQVLSNLINNAIKFTEPGGSVIVSADLSSDGSHLQLCVRDTGCGISPADVEHVFDRLFQVEVSENQVSESGLGLGLSIASEIVSLHGGKLVVNSREGQGSEFYFELCVARQASIDQLDDDLAA